MLKYSLVGYDGSDTSGVHSSSRWSWRELLVVACVSCRCYKSPKVAPTPAH